MISAHEKAMRKLQEIYAKLNGYFWLPCPLCGRYFGGHEWHDIGELSSTVYLNPVKPSEGSGICPVCTAQGKGERFFRFGFVSENGVHRRASRIPMATEEGNRTVTVEDIEEEDNGRHE